MEWNRVSVISSSYVLSYRGSISDQETYKQDDTLYSLWLAGAHENIGKNSRKWKKSPHHVA